MSKGRLRHVAVLLLVGALAAGCEFLGITEKPPPPPPCPPIFVLKDAGALTRYDPGAGRDITEVSFQGRITDFRGICDYDRARTKVDIALEVVFNLVRGPANRDHKAAFEYFVAIPHFHPAPQGKSTFAVSGTFAGNAARLRLTDEVQLQIPLPSKARLEDYAIYIGFQLTREELEENQRSSGPLIR